MAVVTVPELRPKAMAALRDGRVNIVRARCRDTELAPFEVVALVRSSRDIEQKYAVDLFNGEWSCVGRFAACPQPCAHVAAVQLVTGHPSPAAKPEPIGEPT